jgi:hypothetical protein
MKSTRDRLLIGDRWVEPEGGATMPEINPATPNSSATTLGAQMQSVYRAINCEVRPGCPRTARRPVHHVVVGKACSGIWTYGLWQGSDDAAEAVAELDEV